MQSHRSLKLNTEPATQIVSTADMKTYLQVDDSDDDTEIVEAIVAARKAIENYTGRSFINTVWNLWLDSWPIDQTAIRKMPEGVHQLPINHFDGYARVIEILRPPLVSVASITYYDTADSGTVFSSSKYLVDVASEPGRIILNDGDFWPSTLLRPGKAIDIQFTAGYGTDVTDIPQDIILAHKQMVKFFYRVMTGGYEQGETPMFQSDQNKSGLTDFVEKLLMPYRVTRF